MQALLMNFPPPCMTLSLLFRDTNARLDGTLPINSTRLNHVE